MADESLVLRLEAYDRLSSKLRDVSRQFSEIATQAGVTAAAIQSTESEADDLGDELSSLNRDLATTTATLGATTAAFRALDGAIDDIDGDIDLDIPNLSDELGDTRKRFAVVANTEGVRQALAGLDSEDRTIDVDVNPVLSGFRDRLASIDPDDRTLSLGVETDDLAAAAVAIDRLKDRADSTRASLLTLDDTGVSIDLDVDDPRRSLSDLDTVDLPARFDTAFDIDDTARDFSTRLRSALPDEFDLDLDSRIDIGTDTDLAAIETVRASLASLPASVRSEIDVDADLGAAERAAATLRALPDVSRRIEADAAFDVDTSTLSLATSLLEDLSDDQIAALDIETDADTDAIEHTQALLASLAARDTVAEVDTEADLDAISETHTALESLPDNVRARIEVDRDTDVTARTRTALASLASRAISIPIDIDADFDTIAAVHAALDTLPDRVVSHVDVDRPDSVDVGATAGSVSPDIDTPDAGTVTPRAGTVAPDLTLPDGGTIRPDVDMPTPDAVEIPTDMDIRGTRQYMETLRDRVGGFDERIDISLGDSEREVLSALSNLRAGLESLPEDERVKIFTQADLDDLVATMGGIEALPDEVDFDVDAHTAEAQAGLSAVLAQAQAMDGLSVDIGADVDTDTGALSVLREGGDGFDFDFPDMPDVGDGRRGGLLSEGAGGFRQLMGGLAQGVPGIRGAASALGGGMTAAGLAGAGAGVGGLAALLGSAVSGAGGAALGGGLAVGAIGIPAYLSVDDREKQRLNQEVQAAIEPLRTNRIFESISDTILSDIPYVLSEIVSRVESLDSLLQDTFQGLRGSFFENLPALLDSAEGSVRALSDDLQSMGQGVFEALPGIMDSMTQSADTLIPILEGWMARLGPIIGGMVSVGDALFQVLDAPIRAILDPLAAFMPITDLLADGLLAAGEALSFMYDNIGAQVWREVGGAIEWAVGWIRFFAEGLYNIADRMGIIDAIAGAFRTVGDAIGSFGLDDLASGLNAALGPIEGFANTIIDVYNRLNDLPGVGGEDIQALNLDDLTADDLAAPGSGGEGGGGGAPPTAPGVATITDSAVASLPSGTTTTTGTETGTGTATSSTATASTSSTTTDTTTTGTTTAATGGGETTIYRAPKFKAVIQNQGTFTRKDARKLYREMERQDQKRTGPGVGG